MQRVNWAISLLFGKHKPKTNTVNVLVGTEQFVIKALAAKYHTEIALYDSSADPAPLFAYTKDINLIPANEQLSCTFWNNPLFASERKVVDYTIATIATLAQISNKDALSQRYQSGDLPREFGALYWTVVQAGEAKQQGWDKQPWEDPAGWFQKADSLDSRLAHLYTDISRYVYVKHGIQTEMARLSISQKQNQYLAKQNPNPEGLVQTLSCLAQWRNHTMTPEQAVLAVSAVWGKLCQV